ALLQIAPLYADRNTGTAPAGFVVLGLDPVTFFALVQVVWPFEGDVRTVIAHRAGDKVSVIAQSPTDPTKGVRTELPLTTPDRPEVAA
ncbi:hypothetical protein ABTL25_19780, partial [Acinetobacter baumannii]